MKKLSILLMFVFLSIAIMLPACESAPTPTPGITTVPATAPTTTAPKNIQWDFITNVGDSHAFSTVAKQFADAVRQRSNGMFDIRVRVSGQLPYSATDAIRVIKEGLVQISLATSSVPEAGLLAVPTFMLLLPDLGDRMLVMEWLKPIKDAQFKKYDAQLAVGWLSDPVIIWSANKEVKTIQDLKGMKIRVYNSQLADTLSALGATPVTVDIGELYTALQRGTVDGYVTGYTTVPAQKFDEVTKYAYTASLVNADQWIVVKRSSLADLPDDMRQILMDEFLNFSAKWWEIQIPGQKKIRSQLESKGIVFNQVLPEDTITMGNAIKPLWDKWAAAIGPDAVQLLAQVKNLVGR